MISFPFSNLAESKVRPVIVVSNDKYNGTFDDFIAVPLTSNLKVRDYTLLVTNNDLEGGKLIVDSLAKADKIFSVEKSLVRMKIGKLKRSPFMKLRKILVDLVEPS